MKPFARAASCWFGLVLIAGCSTSTEVTERQRYEGAQLPYPDRIIVHDFTADPAEVPPESAFADKLGANPPAPEQAADAGRLGSQVAQKLAAELQGMGLPAVAAAGQPAPKPDDIVLRGYFVSVDPGSATERVLVGFGQGAAELRSALEAYQMTPEGLRLLGSGEVRSGGADTPGMALPLGVVAATANPIGLVVGGVVKLTGEATGSDTIEGAAERTAEEMAAQLKTAAQEQGWI